MVTLDYQLSSSWKNQLASVDLRTISASSLHYDLFLGDIVFKCDEADFSAPWDWVPVLDFTMGILRIARNLYSSTNERFEFTESEATLDFVRCGDRVRVVSNYSPASAVVAYEDLHAEAERFARRVIDDLAGKFPDLCESEAFQQSQQEVLSQPEPSPSG